jgi:hypothetical protein
LHVVKPRQLPPVLGPEGGHTTLYSAHYYSEVINLMPADF